VWSGVPFAESSVLVGTILINIIWEIIMTAMAGTMLIAVIHSVIIIIVVGSASINRSALTSLRIWH
jgi:hypothetical protein